MINETTREIPANAIRTKVIAFIIPPVISVIELARSVYTIVSLVDFPWLYSSRYSSTASFDSKSVGYK